MTAGLKGGTGNTFENSDVVSVTNNNVVSFVAADNRPKYIIMKVIKALADDIVWGGMVHIVPMETPTVITP